MKIYMVSFGTHEDLEICGYFSSQEKAEEYMKENFSGRVHEWGWNEVEEWEIDVPREP